jgi:hypothetical protein
MVVNFNVNVNVNGGRSIVELLFPSLSFTYKDRARLPLPQLGLASSM